MAISAGAGIVDDAGLKEFLERENGPVLELVEPDREVLALPLHILAQGHFVLPTIS